MPCHLTGSLLSPIYQLFNGSCYYTRIPPRPASSPPPSTSISSSIVSWWEKPMRRRNIVMKFESDVGPFLDNKPTAPDAWTAYLELETFELPSVMTSGLYVTSQNIQESGNYVKKVYSPTDKRWYYSRKFTLVDPQWSGSLGVSSYSMKSLSDFRVEDLSANLVHEARVDKEGKDSKTKCQDFVYSFHLCVPDNRINCLYGNMPMQGLWPWPRRENEQDEDKETQEQAGNDIDSETDPGMDTPDSMTDLKTNWDTDSDRYGLGYGDGQ